MELILADKSPALGYGVAVAVRDQIFVHGGITIRTSDTSAPSNSCHMFDCEKQVWRAVTDGPSLSFHAAYVTSDRFVHLIGGWNGKSRSSCVYIYDARESVWLPTCKTLGFPNGAGLSGHTAMPIQDDGCLITGRLGGLQTQRRSGCVLTLHPIAFPTVYRYEVLSELVHSRSGHTCTRLMKNKKSSCLLLGGRDQDVVELLKYDRLLSDGSAGGPSQAVVTLTDGYHRTPLVRPPSRRYHIALPVFDKHGIGHGVLMHGGESFASTAKGPSKQGPAAVVLSTDPSAVLKSGGATVYALDECEESMPRLTGHRAVRIKDEVFVVGGFGENWRLNKNLYKVKM